MLFRKMIGAALPALALAGLVACQSDENASDRPALAPQEDYKSVNEVPFLSDDAGNVMRKVPLEVLKDVHRQLRDNGQEAQARLLAAQYDFTLGEVKDERAALRAEAFLKANLTQGEAAPVEIEPARVISAADLPEGITLPKELVEALGVSGAKGGAR
jgi:hypothetical protein